MLTIETRQANDDNLTNQRYISSFHYLISQSTLSCAVTAAHLWVKKTNNLLLANCLPVPRPHQGAADHGRRRERCPRPHRGGHQERAALHLQRHPHRGQEEVPLLLPHLQDGGRQGHGRPNQVRGIINDKISCVFPPNFF